MPFQSKKPSKQESVPPTAYQHDPSPGSWQMWYADADFDDGSMLVVTYSFGALRPPGDSSRRIIEFSFYDPQGMVHTLRTRFSQEECKASEDKCNVVMGHNFYREEDGKYHVHFSNKGLSCDLTYEPILPVHYVHHDFLPGRSESSRWYMTAPRAKVKGTVAIGGKAAKVEGEGYTDVSWDSQPMLSRGKEDLFWGRLFLGDWSFFWQAGTLVVGRGAKILFESAKGITSPLDVTTTDSPVERPQRIRFKISDPGVVEGEIDFKVLQVLEFIDLLKGFKKPFQRWFATAYVGRPAYMRYRLEYNVNLKVRGERVTSKGTSWCEHHKLS